MFGRRQNLEIFNRIVGPVSINVMNNLVCGKNPPNILLHHETVLGDSVVDCLGVVWCPDHHITSVCDRPSTLPIWILPSSGASFMPAILATEPTIDAGSSVVNQSRLYLEDDIAFSAGKRNSLAAFPLIRLFSSEGLLELGVTAAIAKVSRFIHRTGANRKDCFALSASCFDWHFGSITD